MIKKREIELIKRSIDLQAALAVFRSGESLPLSENAVGVLDIVPTEENRLSESDLQDVFSTVIPFGCGDGFQYQVSRPQKAYLDAFTYCLEKNVINKWIAYFCTRNPSINVESTSDVILEFRGGAIQTLNDDSQWTRFIDFLQNTALRQDGMYTLSISGFTLDEIYNDSYIPILAQNFSSVIVSTMEIECLNEIRYLRGLQLRL